MAAAVEKFKGVQHDEKKEDVPFPTSKHNDQKEKDEGDGGILTVDDYFQNALFMHHEKTLTR